MVSIDSNGSCLILYQTLSAIGLGAAGLAAAAAAAMAEACSVIREALWRFDVVGDYLMSGYKAMIEWTRKVSPML